MPKLVGGILALVALGSSLLAHADPITCLLRGATAFIVGIISTQIWYVFFTVRVQKGISGSLGQLEGQSKDSEREITALESAQ